MKDPQLHFFAKLGRLISPHRHRDKPLVWFREVRILRKLESGGYPNEVRKVTLRRGLNVIWAPPEEADEPELYGDGLSGHASGKTLFCRLLRYLLGEANYGPKLLKESVEEAFDHELWVVAEIFLENDLWLVARPMAGNAHRFAIKNVSIDELLEGSLARRDYSEFAKALEQVTCGPVLEASEGEVQFGWRYLLPWLARDQESRFAGLTEWRSSLAESENPQTSSLEQHELIKTVAGLVKGREIRLRSQLHSTESSIKQLNEELPALLRASERDYTKLVASLKRAGIDNFTGLETVQELQNRKENQTDGLKMWLEQEESDEDLVTAKGKWEEAVREQSNLDGRLTQAEQSLQETKKALEGRTSRYQKLKASGIPNPARLEQGMCPMTLDYAINIKKCVTPPPGASLETDLSLGDIISEADELEQLARQQDQQVGELKTLRANAEQQVTQCYALYAREKNRVSEATKTQREWLRQLSGTSILFESAEESSSAVALRQESLEAKIQGRNEIKKDLSELRLDHVDAEQRLSDAFADAIRAAMGGKVEPSVSSNDRGFSLSVKRKGELSGAALETIKVLAFDLAVMILSIEGIGFHPRFLIHDGPREADMARLIYERFFLYARKLEESFADSESSSFQYIITTTSAPPKDMRYDSKWLRLQLNTAIEHERLLRVNL